MSDADPAGGPADRPADRPVDQSEGRPAQHSVPHPADRADGSPAQHSVDHPDARRPGHPAEPMGSATDREPGPTTGFLDPEVVPVEAHRRASRVLLIDGDRVLLEHVRSAHEPVLGSWWELPGGGIEPGETTAEAALRELREESGYIDVELGPVIATARVLLRGERRSAEQHSTFHVGWLRSRDQVALDQDPGEADNLLEMAWVPIADLADGRRLIPAAVADLARDVAAGRLVPRRIEDAAPDTRIEANRTLVQANGDPGHPSSQLPHGDDERTGEPGPTLRALQGGGDPRFVEGMVVRDVAPWTPSVHAWLAHCHDQGIDAVPRPLGTDAFGREAVSYLPGEVTAELPGTDTPGTQAGTFPSPMREPDGLAAVGALLKRLGDAAATFEPPLDPVWRLGPATLRPGQALCHGDIGHANLVWREDGTPGLIDWEFAHPGPPLRDLAEAACWLVPLVDFDHERRGFDHEPDRHARLSALAAGAGVTVGDLLQGVHDYVAVETQRVRELGGLGITPWDGFLVSGQVEGFARVTRYLAEHHLG